MKRIVFLVLQLVFLWCIPSLTASGKIANAPRSWHAKPGMGTTALQGLIDKVSKSGGGRLVLPQGEYLTGRLELKSGVELHLEEGAVVLGSTSPYDYTHVNAREGEGDLLKDNSHLGLIVAKDAHNIAITGKGIIDGQGLALALTIDSLHHTGERIDSHYNVRRNRPSELVRPTLLNIVDCRGVRLEGVSLRNSAGWGLSFNSCRDMVLRHLDIYNRAYWNNDGIDLTDCKQVLVEQCKVNSADDGICLKSYHADGCNDSIIIRECEIRSSASAIKFGSASFGGFRHIRIHGIRVFDTFRSALAIESVDGAVVEDVVADDITAVNTGNPLFIRLGQRSGERKGVIRNIRITNLSVEVPFGRPDIDYNLRGPDVDYFHNIHPAPICGIPGNCIEDVHLENIRLVYPGRATKGMAYIPLWRKGDVPEQVDNYPEFTMFGELPSWGFYLRHVRNITLKNVQLLLSAEDFRPAIVDEDVEGLQLEHVEVGSILPDR
ncbi:MAG: glycoside hydrolase family 28 protein [Bacteroidaceae bacterium]|nr:glycoside hydrolase family 28 protein [Bacteroidaceae bacterium]